ncbi:hypothetical protein F4804DRAFT_4799 [Jackrogersella minutella]|nr:hypothetical protein F4804DRAFT_4799 [Jackrogersella minutella]
MECENKELKHHNGHNTTTVGLLRENDAQLQALHLSLYLDQGVISRRKMVSHQNGLFRVLIILNYSLIPWKMKVSPERTNAIAIQLIAILYWLFIPSCRVNCMTNLQI